MHTVFVTKLFSCNMRQCEEECNSEATQHNFFLTWGKNLHFVIIWVDILFICLHQSLKISGRLEHFSQHIQ